MPPSNASKSRTAPMPKSTRGNGTKNAAPATANDVSSLATRIAAVSLATPEERRTTAMLTANAASKTLTAVLQTGWKKSANSVTKSKTEVSVNGAASKASAALEELRELCPRDIDAERSASSIIAKLVSLEMFDLALSALTLSHGCITELYPKNSYSNDSKLSLLSLPLPVGPLDEITLTLVSTYLCQILVVFSALLTPKDGQALSDSLRNDPTLLAWMPFLNLPEKHVDLMLKRAYTALTKAASSPSSDAVTSIPHLAIFHIRMYAISCLALTSPGAIAPATFWDQASRFSTAFIHAVTKGKPKNTAEREHILDAYEGLVTTAANNEHLMKDKGFIGFCDHWMEFAQRAGDIKTLDRIGSLTSSVPSTSSVTTTKNSYESSDAYIAQISKQCTIYAQTTAALDRSSFTEEVDLIPRVNNAINPMETSHLALIAFATESDNIRDEQVQRAKLKLEHALEKLRRSGIKYIERQTSFVQGLEAAKRLLGVIVDVLGKQKPEPDAISCALETTFILARKTLTSSDANTYSVSFGWMEKAVEVLSNCKTKMKPDLDQANYLRCVSGAFYTLSGTLYQANKHGPAIKFFKEACEIGREALCLYRQLGEQNSKQEAGALAEDEERRKKNLESWKVLDEGLYRRWELLGICYRAIDKKLAHAALIESIKGFPNASSKLTEQSQCTPVSALFDIAAFKQLGAIIDRATHLAVSELLLDPKDVSLRQHFPSNNDDIAFIGLLLERQIRFLVEGGMAGKPPVQSAIQAMLEDALDIYAPKIMPVRRARILLRCLEIEYHHGHGVIEVFGSVEKIGNQIEECLVSKNLANDSSLASFIPQYRASGHLWLALHAHKRADKNQSAIAIAHVDAACAIFKTLIYPPILYPKGKSKAVGRNTAPVRKKIPVGKAIPVTRASVAPKKTTALSKDPVTPKRTRSTAKALPELVKISPAKSNTGEVKETEALVFDDFDKLLALIQITARLLGLLGLVLPKVSLLDAAKQLSERRSTLLDDAYVISSTDLAHEYMCLGKTKRAAFIYKRLLSEIRAAEHATSIEARVAFFLRYAQSLAISDCVPQSSEMYLEALRISDDLPGEEKGLSTSQRLRTRVLKLERAAIAAHVFASIQFSKEDATTSLEGLLQSLRLWNRAVDNLSRLIPASATPTKTPAVDSNPFDMATLADALPTPALLPSTKVEQPTAQKVFVRRPSMDGLEWRIADGLLCTQFALTQAYFSRGSPREAEYFAQQAYDLSLSLNAPAMASRALARKGEVQLHQGNLAEGLENLIQAGIALENIPGADFADIQRLKGDHSLLSGLLQGKDTAEEMYSNAMNILDELNNNFGIFDRLAGPRKSVTVGSSTSQEQSKEVLVPVLLAAVLRQHIWLLRGEASETSQLLLDRLLSLPPLAQIKLEENGLMAKLALHEVYELFRSNMFLSSLAESTIALPMGMSGDPLLTVSPATQEILSTLDNAEELFWFDLAVVARRGDVSHVRDAAVSLALIRALQTSLGRISVEGPIVASRLLDISTAITLRRELLETIQKKFPDVQTFDDMQWPLIDAGGFVLPKPNNARTQARLGLLEPSEVEEEPENRDLKKYWESVRAKYQGSIVDAPSLAASQTATLPVNWTVVHISVTSDKSTLFITRQRGGGQTNTDDLENDPAPEPLMFCVPLKGRRESGEEEDDHLSFDGAIQELKEIIRLSNEGTRGAVHIKPADASARSQWWKNRAELDKRMEDLVENVEFCWLGAFKTILNPAPKLSPETISDLRAQFDKVFQWGLHLQDKKAKARAHGRHNSTNSINPKTSSKPRHKVSASVSQTSQQLSLDDSLLECFSTLSPKCRDEELEDLVYFVLDLYQFHGVSVAIAEVDIDQVVVDLRTVLDDFTTKQSRVKARQAAPKVSFGADEHIFLVLDKNVQSIPWESIPVLRGRSVSRIPSVDFLKDRIDFAAWQQKGKMRQNRGAIIDPRKAYYILNPNGDLGKTEGRFADWLSEMKTAGWDGIIGKPPSEQQFLDALARQDLVVYFGHGGGEQYVRSQQIKHLPRCAATMLWGCSSGALKEMGNFDPVGTPYNYMLAGCPTLVATLWDITDRDIDKFSQIVFDQLRMTPTPVKQWTETQVDGVSVVAAVSKAREACKLRYLTGAAPVVYGIPFYL